MGQIPPPPRPNPRPSCEYFLSFDQKISACLYTTTMGQQAAKPTTKVAVAVDNRSNQSAGVHLALLEFHENNPVVTLVLMAAFTLVALYVYKRYCHKRCCKRAHVAKQVQQIEMKPMMKAIEAPAPLAGLIIEGVEYIPK